MAGRFDVALVSIGYEDARGTRRVVFRSEADGEAVFLAVRMDPAGEIVGVMQAENHDRVLRHVRLARPIVRQLLRRYASQLEIPGVAVDAQPTNTRGRAGPAPVQLRIPGT